MIKAIFSVLCLLEEILYHQLRPPRQPGGDWAGSDCVLVQTVLRYSNTPQVSLFYWMSTPLNIPFIPGLQRFGLSSIGAEIQTKEGLLDLQKGGAEGVNNSESKSDQANN